jgi:DNA-binding CsgD family transcriptional regulator
MPSISTPAGALDAGRAARAARLHAASRRLRDELGIRLSPLSRLFRLDDESAVGDALTAQELAVAQEEGARLELHRAVAYATRSRGPRSRPRAGWDSLTPTERDVVTLAARGMSNQAIGAELLSSAGTVRTHLRSVFATLAVTSRAELAAEAARRGL